jgi:hypothetical protein
VSAHQIKIASGKSMFDLNIAVFYPTERLKRLLKRQDATLRFRIVRGECMQKKTRRMRSGCCASATIGHAAAPPNPAMNARRFVLPSSIRLPPP